MFGACGAGAYWRLGVNSAVNHVTSQAARLVALEPEPDNDKTDKKHDARPQPFVQLSRFS